MGKHYFNLGVMMLLNTLFNLTVVAFVWKVDHTFAIAITGLAIMRFVAEGIFKRGVRKEAARLENEMIEQFEKEVARMKASGET